MNTTLLLTLLTAYVLGMVIMFVAPEGWMPKGSTPDRIISRKGFGRTVFIIGSAIVIVIALLISCLLS
jgi:cytochrome c biogenesis protein CcdA